VAPNADTYTLYLYFGETFVSSHDAVLGAGDIIAFTGLNLNSDMKYNAEIYNSMGQVLLEDLEGEVFTCFSFTSKNEPSKINLNVTLTI